MWEWGEEELTPSNTFKKLRYGVALLDERLRGSKVRYIAEGGRVRVD